MISSKFCPKCKTTKTASEFSPKRSHRDGLAGWCKACRCEDERTRRVNPRLIKAHKRKYENEPAYRAKSLVKAIEKRCRKNGLAFDLDVKWVADRIAAGRCELTGLPFDMTLRDRALGVPPLVPSVDRVVPANGYTKENCRVVLFAVNAALSHWGLDTFLPIALAMVARNAGRRAA